MKLLALEQNFADSYLAALENASEDQVSAAAGMFAGGEAPSIIHRLPGTDTAFLSITGLLSPGGPTPIERFFGFGGTSYRDIVAAAAELKADPEVKTVRAIMDTPGGYVAGVDSARSALAELSQEKDLIAENHGMIASAGYYLASAANIIVAKTRFAKTGSIGVIVAGIDVTGAMERAGVKRVKVVSSNAPNKAPDIGTESGRQVIQDEIDATERVFIQTVAEGRGVTPEYVKENFGRGGLLIAQDPDTTKPDALSVGMIDSVDFGATVSATGTGETAGPTTFQDFPLIDQPWDSAAAIRRVRTFMGAEDAPTRRYRQAFFWYNSEESENFGAYKLPFVDVVDGRLTANIRGVNAANGSMSGARGQRVDIPEADRPRVQSHIDRYRAKWRREQDNGEGGNALGSKAAEGGQFQNKEKSVMDLSQLKTEHPDVYAAAVQHGVNQERERVTAHLTMGDASGDMALAVTSINEGIEMTSAVSSKYMAAHMKRTEQEARAAENVDDVTTREAKAGEESAALLKATAEALGVPYDG